MLSRCIWFSSFSCDAMFQIQYIISCILLSVSIFMAMKLSVSLFFLTADSALNMALAH